MFFLVLGFITVVTVQQQITHKTFFEVEINGEPAGRIVFGLFGKIAPLATENFKGLCTGEFGKGEFAEKLHFENSYFHSSIPGFMVQGGDIVNFDGTAGESVYGYAFKDDKFILKHDQEGLLTTINSGPNSNTSLFGITLAETYFLDGRHVVFGKVLDGISVIKTIESIGSKSGKIDGKVRIARSGEEN